MKLDHCLVCLLVLALNQPVGAVAEGDPLDDWKDLKFGMFVHWGLYSGLAGTWEGRPVATRGGMEWIQQRVGADTETYAKAAVPLFQPRPDFAREWAELARETGCRYVVFTTKHHDGFALHDSAVGTFHAGAVLGRDLVREIVDALRAESLRVGFYHSVIDWHHDQYEYRCSSHLPHPLRGQPYPNGARDHAIYLDYLHAQVEELAGRYGPVDIFWWDYSAIDFQGEEAWRAFELMEKVRARQPRVVMNNRLFRIPEAGWRAMGTSGAIMQLDRRYGDFITPEQHVPATGVPGLAWETCMTMNTTWGYSEHDHEWKSAAELIRHLVDIVSKGGNYLLNIGPKADGTVPAESVELLRAIGAWMAVNGESIHGTTASLFPRVDWGRSTTRMEPDGATLFLHVFDWPESGELLVPGLRNPLRSARLLDGDTPLAARASEEGVVIRLPATAPDAVVSVIRLQVQGPPVVGAPTVRQGADGVLVTEF